MARKPVLAGNWKMNMNAAQAKELTAALLAADIDLSTREVVLGPSFTNVYPVAEMVAASGKGFSVAAQNLYFETSGAFTGEVSADMLTSAGATHVILGHSERRTIFGETDELINKKVHKALASGLTAIFCVGELLSEREAGVANETVLAQVGKGLAGVTSLDNVVIAYEPVWAIGTGKTASAADAQDMHAAIRALIAKLYGEDAAQAVRILYGGSVKADNAASLMAQPDVDGALVGGASLKAADFLGIVNFDK